jgi:transposase
MVNGAGASAGAGTVAMERVEIVTRGERLRSYSSEMKARLLMETAAPGTRVLEVAQRHGISPSLLNRWRREAEGRPARCRRLSARRHRAAASRTGRQSL